MDFSEINGIDEGSVGILIVSIMSAWGGDNEKFWKTDMWVPIYNDYMPRN